MGSSMVPPSVPDTSRRPLQLEKKRTDMFNAAIDLFNAKNYEAALIEFENIVSLEPKNFIGDNFEKVTQVFKVSQYNVACCYSMLNAVEPGLEALQVAMSCGFDDFGKIRKDPSLRALQNSDKFKKLLDKYDEPLFNEVSGPCGGQGAASRSDPLSSFLRTHWGCSAACSERSEARRWARIYTENI